MAVSYPRCFNSGIFIGLAASICPSRAPGEGLWGPGPDAIDPPYSRNLWGCVSTSSALGTPVTGWSLNNGLERLVMIKCCIEPGLLHKPLCTHQIATLPVKSRPSLWPGERTCWHLTLPTPICYRHSLQDGIRTQEARKCGRLCGAGYHRGNVRVFWRCSFRARLPDTFGIIVLKLTCDVDTTREPLGASSL